MSSATPAVGETRIRQVASGLAALAIGLPDLAIVNVALPHIQAAPGLSGSSN